MIFRGSGVNTASWRTEELNGVEEREQSIIVDKASENNEGWVLTSEGWRGKNTTIFHLKKASQGMFNWQKPVEQHLDYVATLSYASSLSLHLYLKNQSDTYDMFLNRKDCFGNFFKDGIHPLAFEIVIAVGNDLPTEIWDIFRKILSMMSMNMFLSLTGSQLFSNPYWTTFGDLDDMPHQHVRQYILFMLKRQFFNDWLIFHVFKILNVDRDK